MWMVILLWVTMATPPWPSIAWGFWVGLDGATTHREEGHTNNHTQLAGEPSVFKDEALVLYVY